MASEICSRSIRVIRTIRMNSSRRRNARGVQQAHADSLAKVYKAPVPTF
jgi:hypothetical protein